MGKHVRIVRLAGIKWAILQLKAEHRAEVERHPNVMRYLRDHRPDIYDKVRQCRNKARVARHAWKPDTYKVRLYGCHVEPWCFACSRESKFRRANKVLDRFYKCTPKGKEPRFAHIVQTAQFRDDGTGWGHRASKDVKAFRDIIARVVSESYGSGFGAFMSYQDFGERAFAKTHPHMDFALNGWSLTEQGPDLTRQYDLKNGGHNIWLDRTKRHAGARFLLHTDDVETNLNIQGFVVGPRAYYGALLYQVRELVDVRKMTYDKQRQLVYWSSYRENRREKMTISQFHEGLADYTARLGDWGKFQARKLHVGVGHMADHRLDETQDAMGGETKPHSRSCVCSECQEWEVVWPDAEGEYGFDPWRRPDETVIQL